MRPLVHSSSWAHTGDVTAGSFMPPLSMAESLRSVVHLGGYSTCRWTPEHERLRAAAILALLAVPFARHADVAAAVGRSRRTIERWINRGVYFPESLAVRLAELGRFDLTDPARRRHRLRPAAAGRATGGRCRTPTDDPRRIAVARVLVERYPAADTQRLLRSVRAERAAAPALVANVAADLLAA